MDLHGIPGHGFRGAHVGWKRFQIDLDLLGCSPGMLFRVSANDRDRIPELEHFCVAQNRTIPSVTLVPGESDEPGDSVLALHVLVGDDLVHTRHLFRLRGIDLADVGMGDLGLNQGKAERFRGHFETQIGPIVQSSSGLGNGRRPRVLASPDLAVFGELVFQISDLHLSPHHFCRIHHRIDQLLVPGTAAGIAVGLEPVPHLGTVGVGVLVQQSFGRNDEARGAEPALRSSVHHPGQLERMQVGWSPDAFNSENRCAVRHFRHFGDTGAHQLLIHDDVAGPALTLAAADFGPCEA